MKKLLIIPIVLIMFSCGRENPQRVAQREYHKELYETVLQLSNQETEDLLEENEFSDFVMFITRHRTRYGGYTPPILYRWYEETGYKPIFVLSYNPKEFVDLRYEDKERFFPNGLPDTLNVQE